MDFKKQQTQLQSFQNDVESLELQLKEMSRLFFQNEEKISSDLRQLREKFSIEVNEMHTKIKESKDEIKSEYNRNQNHIKDVLPALDKKSKMNDGLLTEEANMISNQDEVANKGKILGDSSKQFKNKAPQESLEEDAVFQGVEVEQSDHAGVCSFIDAMPDEETINVSNQGEGINDDKTFEGGYKESVKDTCQTISDPLERSSEPSNSPKRGMIDGFTKIHASIRKDNQDQDDEPYRSGSFHMYAVGIVTDSTKSSRHGWAVAWISVIFTFFQFFVLTTVVYEASHPTCISHDECRLGEYCDLSDDQWKGTKRCMDCADYTPIETNTNCPSLLSDMLDYSHPDYVEIDHTKIGYDFNLNDFNETQQDCLVQAHCGESDVDEYSCDFLRFNRSKWHITQQVVFIFMAMLFAALLCSDIQDAIAEEAYMTFGLRNSSLGSSQRMACEFLRTSLRSRQFILPWYATSAAIAIIIIDPLTAQNMLLNLLTIEVILIADDMFATFVLPLFHQDSTDKLMRQATQEGVKVSYMQSRVQSLIATLVLVITIFEFDKVLEAFISVSWYDEGTKCGDIAQSLETFLYLMFPLCTGVMHGIVVSFLVTGAKLTKRIMLGIGQFLIDLNAWILASIAWQIALVITTWAEPTDIILPCLVSFNVLYYGGHMLRVWFAWRPVIKIHEALYGE